MPAHPRRARGLHAGHAAADHHDAPLERRRRHGVARVAADLRVDCAAHGQLREEAPQAALVAGDARADLLGPAGLDLAREVRVREHRPADGHRVEPALLDALLVKAHVAHARAHDDRDLHGLLGALGELGHVAARQVHGRARVVERVVGPGVHVERVVARGLEQLADAHALLEGAVGLVGAVEACLHEALGVGLEAQAHGDGEVLAAGLLDALADLAGDAQAVLEAAAVLVRAAVGERGGKLVEQVAPVDRVHLHAVEARPLGYRRGLDELLDLAVDLVDGELGGDLVRRAEDRVLGRPAEAGVVAAQPERQLHEEPCPVGAGAREHGVGGGEKRVGRGAEGPAERGVGVDLGVGVERSGLEQAHAALRAADEVLDARRREGPVGVEVGARGDRRHHEPVLDGHLADGKRAVECRELLGHANLLLRVLNDIQILLRSRRPVMPSSASVRRPPACGPEGARAASRPHPRTSPGPTRAPPGPRAPPKLRAPSQLRAPPNPRTSPGPARRPGSAHRQTLVPPKPRAIGWHV